MTETRIPAYTPWTGRAAPRSPDAFERAAERLGCEVEEILAVWEVESAGAPYRPDGSLTRRFEPHRMPEATMTWRESLRLSEAERERLFLGAWKSDPRAALEATSWGAPQILGRNHALAGFDSAEAMVRAMADAEDAQIMAFVSFLERTGLDSALRAHDWRAFATGYNGRGQPDVYAARIEAAWRRRSGRRSPVVLRRGSTGADVRRIQRALGIVEDGVFGPETEEAVRLFQRAQGLREDGVVGARSWAALREARRVRPAAQPVTLDHAMERAQKVAAVATTATGGLEALRRTLPDMAYELGMWVLVGLAAVTAVVFWTRWMRARL